MAHFLHFSGVALMVIFMCLQLLGQLANGQTYTRESHSKLVYDTITVDQFGRGHFTTVQAAIDGVPMNNRNWVTIKVMDGFYREKVVIPMEKPYIIIIGQNRHKTQIVWDDHDSLDQSPTFSSFADNIIVKCISFVNSYNKNPSNPRVPAVAARIDGDKSYFYRCGFFGLQDTLWDVGGRHYYRRCTIQGAVDFIFGTAKSIFERCSISVLGGALDPGSAGYITAQGREDPNDANGFVLKECHVFGAGSAYLGRPWRGYSRVIFYNSNFSQVVVPQGWDAWHFEGNEEQFTYAEQGCYGPGADTSRRVKWEKKLDIGTLQELTSLDFVNTDGWLHDLPF